MAIAAAEPGNFSLCPSPCHFAAKVCASVKPHLICLFCIDGAGHKSAKRLPRRGRAAPWVVSYPWNMGVRLPSGRWGKTFAPEHHGTVTAMKRKHWLVGLVSIAALGVAAVPCAACFWKHCCGCNKYSTYICVRPYNAFSPVCFGSICCDGCCPLQACSPSCGGGCPPPSFSHPGFSAPSLVPCDCAPPYPYLAAAPPFPGYGPPHGMPPGYGPMPHGPGPMAPPHGFGPPAGPTPAPPPGMTPAPGGPFVPPAPKTTPPVTTTWTPSPYGIQPVAAYCPPGVYPGYYPYYPMGYWTSAYAPTPYGGWGVPYGR
jgi:hypothetical protein